MTTADLARAWEHRADRGADPATWSLVRKLTGEHAAAAIVPSVVPGANDADRKLVSGAGVRNRLIVRCPRSRHSAADRSGVVAKRGAAYPRLSARLIGLSWIELGVARLRPWRSRWPGAPVQPRRYLLVDYDTPVSKAGLETSDTLDASASTIVTGPTQ